MAKGEQGIVVTMVHMLFAYHRPSLAAQLLGTFENYDQAWKARVANERRLLGQAGTEVVVLSGPDEATIRRTHARYFPGSTVDASIGRAVAHWRDQLRLPEGRSIVSGRPIAVLCTSDEAFHPARLPATLNTVAAANAALQACGQVVEFGGALSGGLNDDDLIVWVCGASTRPEEWERLLELPNPLISLGVCLSDIRVSKVNWRSIDPDGQLLDQLAGGLRSELGSLGILCQVA
jgi:hypothetical protein